MCKYPDHGVGKTKTSGGAGRKIEPYCRNDLLVLSPSDVGYRISRYRVHG